MLNVEGESGGESSQSSNGNHAVREGAGYAGSVADGPAVSTGRGDLADELTELFGSPDEDTRTYTEAPGISPEPSSSDTSISAESRPVAPVGVAGAPKTRRSSNPPVSARRRPAVSQPEGAAADDDKHPKFFSNIFGRVATFFSENNTTLGQTTARETAQLALNPPKPSDAAKRVDTQTTANGSSRAPKATPPKGAHPPIRTAKPLSEAEQLSIQKITTEQRTEETFARRPIVNYLGPTPLTDALANKVIGLAPTLAQQLRTRRTAMSPKEQSRWDNQAPKTSVDGHIVTVAVGDAMKEALPMGTRDTDACIEVFAEDILGGNVPNRKLVMGEHTMHLLSPTQEALFRAYEHKSHVSHGGRLVQGGTKADGADMPVSETPVVDETYLVTTGSGEKARQLGVGGYVVRVMDVGVVFSGLPGVMGRESGPLRAVVVEPVSDRSLSVVQNTGFRLQTAATSAEERDAFHRTIKPTAPYRQITTAIGTFEQPPAPWTTPRSISATERLSRQSQTSDSHSVTEHLRRQRLAAESDD